MAANGQQTSQFTKLLKKRKEMREVDEALEAMKKNYKKRMVECEERKLEFEKKQNIIKEQVIKFEKFIKENDAKRTRAESKIKLEHKLYIEKVEETNKLLADINKLENESKTLLNKLKKLYNYKKFLDSVIEESKNNYEEISEILNRHETLVQSNKDLLNHSQRLEKEVDELRKKLIAIRVEKQNQLLVATSVLQKHQENLEKLKNLNKEQEDENMQKGNKKKNVTTEFTQIIQAIRNLYLRCSQSLRSSPLFSNLKENSSLSDHLDFELDIIQTRIVDLIEITSDYKAELQNSSSTTSLLSNHMNSLSLTSSINEDDENQFKKSNSKKSLGKSKLSESSTSLPPIH